MSIDPKTRLCPIALTLATLTLQVLGAGAAGAEDIRYTEDSTQFFVDTVNGAPWTCSGNVPASRCKVSSDPDPDRYIINGVLPVDPGNGTIYYYVQMNGAKDTTGPASHYDQSTSVVFTGPRTWSGMRGSGLVLQNDSIRPEDFREWTVQYALHDGVRFILFADAPRNGNNDKYEDAWSRLGYSSSGIADFTWVDMIFFQRDNDYRPLGVFVLPDQSVAGQLSGVITWLKHSNRTFGTTPIKIRPNWTNMSLSQFDLYVNSGFASQWRTFSFGDDVTRNYEPVSQIAGRTTGFVKATFDGVSQFELWRSVKGPSTKPNSWIPCPGGVPTPTYTSNRQAWPANSGAKVQYRYFDPSTFTATSDWIDFTSPVREIAPADYTAWLTWIIGRIDYGNNNMLYTASRDNTVCTVANTWDTGTGKGLHWVKLAETTVPPPVITQHPQSQTVPVGSTVHLGVTATGQGLEYQWQRDGVDLSDGGHFSGVMSSTLTVSNVDATVTGNYRCVVSNAGGSTTSNAATLELVNSPPAGAESDFDGDGFADLAIGIPGEAIGSLAGAGAVQVIYGSVNGLEAEGNQFWHQNTSGIAGAAEANDEFGGALTGGDFDGDGLTDLVIGVPGEAVGSLQEAGAVHAIYGSVNGLATTGSQLWNQSSPDLAGSSGTSERFGEAVAGGDFDGDGFADLAVGVPGDTVAGVADAGSVHVLYGSFGGLSGSHDVILSQNTVGVPGGSEAGDRFGAALAVGDFDADGFDDLAIGAPGEALGSIQSAGAINVLYGSASGLSGNSSQLANQDTAGISDVAGASDQFGASLAAGDFDGDGHVDLAIGVPGETVSSRPGAGAFHIVYGTAGGLSTTGEQFWHQDSSGIAGGAESGDRVGSSLAAGDFDGDGLDDLAAGADGETLGAALQAGLAHVLYGTSNGLSSSGSQLWKQELLDVEDVAESFDQFGAALSSADFNGDGRDDLAVGVPGEGVGSAGGAGAVNVLYGSSSGVNSNGDQFWHQDSSDILDTAEAGDRFGQSVH